MASANTSRWVLIVLLVVALLLTARVIEPFLTAFFVAGVLAVALAAPTRGLARLLGGRRRLAAAAMTLVLVLAVLVPLGTLGAFLVKEIVDGIDWIRQALESEGLGGLVARLPVWMQGTARHLLAELPHGARDLQELATRRGGSAAAALGGFLTATGTAVLHTVLMLIAFFFFLVDGRSLVEWLKESVPLKRGQMAELLEEFRKVTMAVLVSTVATAGAQAVLALVGYVVAQVPSAIFFTVLTFVLALVPAVGGTIVVLLVGLLHFLTGHRLAGGLLFLWGLVVVGLVDNVLKPLVMRSGMAIHGAVVFFSLLGGLAAFGPVGLVAGPLAFSFLIAAVRMWRRDYGEPR